MEIRYSDNLSLRTFLLPLTRRTAGLDVMDSENSVFRLALTPLTHMTISGQDIFPDIPETELWTVLVVQASGLRVA